MKELPSHNTVANKIETAGFATGRFFYFRLPIRMGHKGRPGRLHKDFHKAHKGSAKRSELRDRPKLASQ